MTPLSIALVSVSDIFAVFLRMKLIIEAFIKTMVEGDKEEVEIPLPNVKSKILEKVFAGFVCLSLWNCLTFDSFRLSPI